jgi:hypothetical protein
MERHLKLLHDKLVGFALYGRQLQREEDAAKKRTAEAVAKRAAEKAAREREQRQAEELARAEQARESVGNHG